MSIATEIQRLNTAKSDIKTAIEAKGVTVPSSATIDTYDDYVSQISGGGGGGDNTTLKKMIDRTITSIDIPSGVTSIGDWAFSNCTSLTSCTIPSGVTIIGDNAFSYCRSLANINIPSGVSSISFGAFQNCTGLTSIDISNSVTNLGQQIFSNCTSLTSVTIPSGVTTISARLFQSCSSLPSIDIPNGVTSIGQNAFHGCTSFTSIDIPSGVTSIGDNCFYNCTGLSSVTVNATTPPSLGQSAFNYTNNCPIYVPCSSVDTYKSRFGWSTYASRIHGIPPCAQPIPTIGCDIIVDSITAYTGSSFSSAFNLENKKWYELNNNSQYEEYGVMGSGRNITTYEGKLTIDGDYEYQYSGNSWANVGQVTKSYGTNATFSKYIDNNNYWELTDMTFATTFSIPVSDVEAVAQEQGGTFTFYVDVNNSEYTLSVSIDEANQMYDYTYTDNNSYNSTAGTITSDSDYYYFYMSDVDSVFCSSFNFNAENAGFTISMELPQFEIAAQGYSTTSYAYSGSTMSTTFSIPKAEVDSIIQAYSTFSITINSEDGMNSLSLSDTDYYDNQGNYGTVYDDGMYYNYSMSSPSDFSVGDINLSDSNNNVHIMFNGMAYPSVLYTDKDPIYAEVFSSTTAMEDARCPDILVGEYGIVGNDAYRLGEDGIWHQVQAKLIARGYDSTSTFVIPSVAPTSSVTKDDFASYSESFTSATIGNSVTYVDVMAFYVCNSLTSIELPSSITSIGQGAFEYCSSLSSVTLNATTPPTLGSSVFDGTDSSLVIYVPSSSVSTYQSASGWSTYASKIQAIPNS